MKMFPGKIHFKLHNSGTSVFAVTTFEPAYDSDEPELEFATWLIKEYGIACVPVSSFYHNNKDNKTMRFCFAKENSTLENAIKILCRI